MRYLIICFLIYSHQTNAAPSWAKDAYKCKKRSPQIGYRMGFDLDCEPGFRNSQDKFCILKRGWCLKRDKGNYKC